MGIHQGAGGLQAGFQAVFVKAVAHPGAGKKAVLLALHGGHAGLRPDGGQVKHRVGVGVFAHHFGRVDGALRVQRHHHRLLHRQRLQLVQQVVQAHLGRLLAGTGRALVVPRSPGLFVLGQHGGVGVQHGVVGLVADGAEHRGFFGRRLVAQQRQRLVAVAGKHHRVKTFDLALGDHAHALLVAQHLVYRGVQAAVGDAGGDLVDILARAAGHGVPLRPVGDLDQAVVVAKPHHGGHGEGQHLVGRAAPDAAHHGQEIPVAELVGKALFAQKFAQGLQQRAVGLQVFTALRQLRGDAVEAHDVGQHAPKARVGQVAALGKHGGQAGAAPFQRAAAGRSAGRLHRKRHVGLGNRHVQGGEKRQQVGVGALVEHQKAGVHPKRGGHALRVGQGHVHGVGVAPKVVARFKQGDVGQPLQRVGGGQPGNARADDGHTRLAWAVCGRLGGGCARV